MLRSFEELQTILCEIEEVLNSRPLVYVSEDDIHESVTPFHLMYGRHISTSDEIPEVGFSECKKRAEHLKTVINHVWKRQKVILMNSDR